MKYLGKLLLLFITSFFTLAIHAQTKPNQIFVEFFGNGILYSINYERHVSNNIYTRVGFATYSPELTKVFSVPLTASCHLNYRKSFLEVGGGATYFSFPLDYDIWDDIEGFALTGILGYGLNANKSLVIRFLYTPFYLGNGIISSGGISFGIRF